MGIIEKARYSVGKAWDHVQNLGDSFKGILGRVSGWCGTIFEVAKNGSTFVGINYTSIGTIREAIKQYVVDVQTEVNKLNTDFNNSNALKGEIATAATQYVEAVSKAANAYVSALLAYSDKMYEYGEAFKKNDTTLASNVASEGRSLESQATTYTEKY